MTHGTAIQNLIVGIVFLGSLVLLGFASLTVKGFHMTEAQPLQVRFETVENLRTGEDVVVYGHAVGEVSDIRFATGAPGSGNVVVTCNVIASLGLTDQTEFRIRSKGPLGGKFVEIVPRPGIARAFDWDGFQGDADPDLLESLNALVGDIRGEGVPPDQAGLLPRLIRDQQLAAKTEQAIEEFRQTFEVINQELADARGLLPRLMRDEELATTVDQIAEEVLASMRRINAEDGIMSDFEAALEGMRKVSDGEGILAYLINDPEGRVKLESFLSSAEAAVKKLEAQDGSLLGKLLSDEELAAKFENIVDNIDGFMDKANNGDGTLAQILNNREAWNEFLRLIVLARESLEDLREQAPINTFANVLFSVF